MEFLNVIAIPHSEQVLKLLEVLFFIGFSLFVLYFAYLFGSSVYSLFFILKSLKTKDEAHLEAAKNLLNFSSKGYVAFIGLGLVPMLSVYYSLLQFIQKAPNDFFNFLLISFVLFVATVIVLKILRLQFSKEGSFLASKWYSIVLLLLVALFTFAIAFITIGVFNVSLNSGFTLTGISLQDLVSTGLILRIILFIGISIILSSLAYIFQYYSADKVSIIGKFFPETTIENRMLSNVLIFGNILPVFLFVYYLLLPKNLVTLSNFILIVSTLLALLLSIILSYFSMKEGKIPLAKYSLIFSIIAFCLFFASDARLLAISNKAQVFKIAKDYVIYHEQILASAGRKTGQQVNGEEIYKAKCVACHQFETKLVGPPHKEVLKKYENRKEDMVKYILNPVKVDPNYPPMPNQGLKPNEAEAVVNYMFEHYGPMLK